MMMLTIYGTRDSALLFHYLVEYDIIEKIQWAILGLQPRHPKGSISLIISYI